MTVQELIHLLEQVPDKETRQVVVGGAFEETGLAEHGWKLRNDQCQNASRHQRPLTRHSSRKPRTPSHRIPRSSARVQLV